MCKIKTGIKMRVTPEQSRKVQEICFKNNIHWAVAKYLEHHIDKPYLYISIYGVLSCSKKTEELFFTKDNSEEVSAELFIRTNGTCVESETPSKQPKTLSEYLKENNAYEEFIENYVEYYLEHIDYYTGTDLSNVVIDIYNISIGENSKHDINYWYNLYMEQPKNLVYDMNDVIFKEVNKRINGYSQPKSEPKTLSEYLKENDAYEIFIDTSVAHFLKYTSAYEIFKKDNIPMSLSNTFTWYDSNRDSNLWMELFNKLPKELIYDMNEIIFNEVDKRITEQESQPESEQKTFSEYLKENNAYGSFVETCVESFLKSLDWYKAFKSENRKVILGNIFTWKDTKEGHSYWGKLKINSPKNLVYDMNEIIFNEVDKRIAEHESQTEFITTEEFDQILEQKTSKRYMVFVEGKNTPRYIHNSYASAETEAKRLSTKLVGLKVSIVEIVKEFKSKVVITELLK